MLRLKRRKRGVWFSLLNDIKANKGYVSKNLKQKLKIR